MNKKAISALSIAILIPLACYLCVKYASDQTILLPRYYLPDSTISAVKDGKQYEDTIWHTVKNIHLVNQLGDSVNLYDAKSKVLVVDFFFTSCGSICPTLTQNMSRLQQSFLKGGNTRQKIDSAVVQFVSFSVDPERDSVAKLKKYADLFGVNHDNWWMLTGSKDSIYSFAFNELKVDKFTDEPIDPDFVHTNRFVLIDKNHHIRGYYNGLDSASLSKLAQDIGLLTIEKDKGTAKLPFDPLMMGVIFFISIGIVIVVMSFVFKKGKLQKVGLNPMPDVA